MDRRANEVRLLVYTLGKGRSGTSASTLPVKGGHLKVVGGNRRTDDETLPSWGTCVFGRGGCADAPQDRPNLSSMHRGLATEHLERKYERHDQRWRGSYQKRLENKTEVQRRNNSNEQDAM